MNEFTLPKEKLRFIKGLRLASLPPHRLYAACEALAHRLLAGDGPVAESPDERLAESILSVVLFESVMRQQGKEVKGHDARLTQFKERKAGRA